MFVAKWMGKKGKQVRRVVKAESYKEATEWAIRQEIAIGRLVRISVEA